MAFLTHRGTLKGSRMVRLIPVDIAKLEDLLRDLKSGLHEICS
jgi:hypothetical protein